MKDLKRYRGSLLGLAAGDAVGTSVEFKRRGSFAPVTDMTGGGTFALKAGEWTDDTSMALCLAASLIEKRGFDARDQMERYVRWERSGYFSSNGRCFDIGGTVRAALGKFEHTGEPFAGSTNPQTAGNGALMRLAPVALFYTPDRELARKYAGESSRTTHGARESVEACMLFADMLVSALAGEEKQAVLFQTEKRWISAASIRAIADGTYRGKTVEQISGSGYVVKSLEAALWCFDHTQDYREAILAASNLGDDADTTAAICGQLAGAFYGEQGIPSGWLEKLTMRDEIGQMAEQLAAGG